MASIFDERNAAVKQMIAQVIATCRALRTQDRAAPHRSAAAAAGLRRGAVQIHVVPVRTNELHGAERIARSGALPQSERAGGHLPQIGAAHRIHRGDDIAPAHDLQPLAFRIGGVAADPRNLLVAGDGGRHVPVRVKDDVPHLTHEHRCIPGAIRASHDDIHALDRPLRARHSVECIETEGGNVHHHEPGRCQVG